MTVLVVRHHPDNHLGQWADGLAQCGLAFKYVDAFSMTPAEFSALPVEPTALIVLGGAMGANDEDSVPFIAPELAYIRSVLAHKRPVLGVCLGAQMLAKALGGSVSQAPIKEVGWTPIYLTPQGEADPVLAPLAGGVPQFQWHQDTYTLPPGADQLAYSFTCPQQAFRLGERVYGLQFHPEVTPDIIDAWLQQSQSMTAEEKAAIWQETLATYSERAQASLAVLIAFCRQAVLPQLQATP